LLAHASAVVGVDTGLSHLAVALGTPNAGLFISTKPGPDGSDGSACAVNLGGDGRPPSVEEVVRVLLGPAAAA